MKKLKNILTAIILCCLFEFSTTTISQAQDNNDRVNSASSNNDNDTDWGWVGLIGLAGLLGLRGKDRAKDHDDRVRSTTATTR